MKKSFRLAQPLPRRKVDDDLIRTVLTGSSPARNAPRGLRSLRGMESLVSCLISPPSGRRRQ